MEDQIEGVFDYLMKLSKHPKRVNILLIGLAGAGKSSFINTVYKALTGNSHKIAKTGKGKTQSVTKALVWYEHCGVNAERIALVDNEKRRKKLTECYEILPNIIDFPGLGEKDDENISEILDRVFGGRIEPGTQLSALTKLQNEEGATFLPSIASSERAVTHVLFVHSWRESVPVKLIECLNRAMETPDENGATKCAVENVTILLTRHDELIYPSANYTTRRERNINQKDFEQRKEEIAQSLCCVESTTDYIVEWINYSDNIQPDGDRKDIIDEIDRNAIKLLGRFLEPGVPKQRPTQVLVNWGMKLTRLGSKLRNCRMEWVMAVSVVLCLLLVYFLIHAIMSPRDNKDSNTFENGTTKSEL